MKEYQAVHPDGAVTLALWADKIVDLSDRTHLIINNRTGDEVAAMFPWPWAVFEVKKPEIID